MYFEPSFYEAEIPTENFLVEAELRSTKWHFAAFCAHYKIIKDGNMAEDSVAAGDNILAMLIEMGEATFDEATVALEKSGGDEKKALDMLMRGAITMLSAKPSKPPKSVCSKVDDDDDDCLASIKAPSYPNYIADASKKKASSTTAFNARVRSSHKAELTKPAKASQKADPKETTKEHLPTPSPSLLLMGASCARDILSSKNTAQADATSASRRGVPSPRPPRITTVPGAVAVPGPDASLVAQGAEYDDQEYTVAETTVIDGGIVHPDAPVSAEVVDIDEENRRIQEEIDRGIAAQREREHAKREAEIPTAEILNEKRLCSKGVKALIAVGFIVVILVIIGVVFGVMLPGEPLQTQTNSPTASPTTSPITSLTELLSNMSSDGGTDLLTPSTPQNDALRWLAGNTHLDTYSDEKKIQRYALATFYYSTDGDNWTDKDGWLTDVDECVWYNEADDGQFCSSSGGVRELDFFHNNIAGTIPKEIGLLSNSLEEFGFVNTPVRGTIPTEIGLLTELTALWLYDIGLTGTIPTEITLMTSLRTAWLHGNNFSGEFTCPSSITQCYVSCTGGGSCRSL